MTLTARSYLYHKGVRFVDREPAEPEWKAVHRAADANLGKIAAAFVGSLYVLREHLDREALRLWLKRNNPSMAVESFPWTLWGHAFGRLVTPRIAETMRAGAEAAGRATIVRKADIFTLQGVFNLLNPSAQRIAALLSAQLVTSIEQATRQAMRDAIDDAVARGISLRDLADILTDTLPDIAGLDRPRARRLERFRIAQLQRGLTQARLDASVAQMRDRLLMDRAKVIARHETINASVAGQVDLWRQAIESGMLPSNVQMEWIVTPQDPQGRLCPICEAMSGQRVRFGQLFYSSYSKQTYKRAPAHVKCLPGDALVLPRGRVTAATKRWVDDYVVVLGVADALPLTCTPNHPVLTRRGWVPASLLNVGDEVARPGFGQGPTAVVDGQYVDRPARIQDIAEPLLVASTPMPTATEDFHGDGVASEVAVVGAYGLLPDTFDAGPIQMPFDDEFSGGGMRTPSLAGTRALALPLDAVGASPGGGVSMADLGGTLSCGHPRPLEQLGLGARSCFNVSGLEPAVDRPTGDIVTIGEGFDGLTAEVQRDDLVYREVVTTAHKAYRGWVYNIETTSGYYLAEGYAIHNCRCAHALHFPD